jgi:hypothetical protein
MDGEALLTEVRAEEQKVFSLKGDATVVGEMPAGKGSGTLFVAARAPLSVHLEQLDFFGRPQSVLVANANEFGLYQSEPGVFYRGPPTAQNLARFLPVPLEPEPLVSALLGRVPRFDGAKVTQVESDGKQYVLSLSGPFGDAKVWVDRGIRRASRVEMGGAWPCDFLFEDMRNIGSSTFPHRVTLSAPKQDTRLEVRYRDMSFNETLDEKLFQPAAPEGATVKAVSADGAILE